MRGQRVNIGIVWFSVTIVMVFASMLLYMSYVGGSFTYDVNWKDVFAITAISLCLSYILTSIIDDVGYKLAPEHEGYFKVLEVKRHFKTLAGRGSTKSFVTYSVSLSDEETSEIIVLYSSGSIGERLKTGEKVKCIIKGNILVDADLEDLEESDSVKTDELDFEI